MVVTFTVYTVEAFFHPGCTLISTTHSHRFTESVFGGAFPVLLELRGTLAVQCGKLTIRTVSYCGLLTAEVFIANACSLITPPIVLTFIIIVTFRRRTGTTLPTIVRCARCNESFTEPAMTCPSPIGTCGTWFTLVVVRTGVSRPTFPFSLVWVMITCT